MRATRPERPVVAGVGISHPDRPLFPAAKATKLDVARYFEQIADWILPHLIDRPLTLVRCAKC
jgi:bifunctional non-homologous end joining protein LigD